VKAKRAPVRARSRDIFAIDGGSPCKFVMTNEYRRFAEFCKNTATEKYFGICTGPPGVGKTIAGRHYADWNRIVNLQTRFAADDTPKFVRNCRTLFYTPSVMNSPYQVEWELETLVQRQSALIASTLSPKERDALDAREGLIQLIIIDEADRLKLTSLEQLRDMFDSSRIGMVLIGMPGFAQKISRLPQFYSRVGFIHEFKVLPAAEFKNLMLKTETMQSLLTLSHNLKVDDDAIAAIARMTHGNYRLLERMGSQIKRLMKINKLRTVDKAVVDLARQSLLIGVS
jgi:DNA transposition AAA+ family ATPase